MSQYGLPVLYALFIWWFSTGLVLYLDGLAKTTFRWSMLGATTLAVAAFYGLAHSAADASLTGAYLAFTCSLVVWGWQEMSYYLGFIKGPRTQPCPPRCTTGQRFLLATRSVLYHELALAASAAAVVTVTWQQPNQIGTWTFMILWAMRLSAKLNVFLGVPNLNEDWLPEHLRYLGSYFGRKPMNLLFPVSVTVASILIVLLVQHALAAAGSLETAGSMLLASLLALAVLEHWFLVLPLRDAALWNWWMGSRPRSESQQGACGKPGDVTIQRLAASPGAAYSASTRLDAGA